MSDDLDSGTPLEELYDFEVPSMHEAVQDAMARAAAQWHEIVGKPPLFVDELTVFIQPPADSCCNNKTGA